MNLYQSKFHYQNLCPVKRKFYNKNYLYTFCHHGCLSFSYEEDFVFISGSRGGSTNQVGTVWCSDQCQSYMVALFSLSSVFFFCFFLCCMSWKFAEICWTVACQHEQLEHILLTPLVWSVGLKWNKKNLNNLV